MKPATSSNQLRFAHLLHNRDISNLFYFRNKVARRNNEVVKLHGWHGFGMVQYYSWISIYF